MAGVNQNVSKMGTFFEKYVPHFMPIFEKKSHPIRPVEGLKLCLDFLCNVRLRSTDHAYFERFSEMTLNVEMRCKLEG